VTDVDGTDTVLYEVADRVATITFNRPERLNAMTRAMRVRYVQLLCDADADPEVGVIVVTGAGRGFCAGADLDTLTRLEGDELRAMGTGVGEAPPDAAYSLTKPLIAAVNGPCAGVGLAHALMADLRFVAADAKITTSFARLGLPAESGMSWLLPRLVGTARALDLLYSARVITGEEAYRIGLAQWVFPAERVLAEATAYARQVAQNSPHSLTEMRRQVYADWERTWDETFTEQADLVARAVERPEFATAVKASRPPRS
jgi:enoyl-CoA hydratase/carnithine racemase